MPNTALVFLDQNHWIYLARSYWDTPLHPSHNGVAADLYEHVLRENVRLPLNVIHLFEYYRNNSAERRARLAEVYEQFSQNWFFTAWDDLIIREIEHAIFSKFAPQLILNPLEVIGQGFFFSFGSKLQEKWKDQSSNSEIDFLKQIIAQSGQLYNFLTFPNEVGRHQQKADIKNINNRTMKAAEDLRAIRGPHLKKCIDWRNMQATQGINKKASVLL